MWNFLEKIYVVLALVYFSGAILGMLGGEVPATETALASNIPLLMLQSLVYCVMIFFILLRFNRTTRLMLPQFWLSALMVWTVASVAWSGDPGRTIRKAIVVCFTTIFGIYFGVRFTLRQQMRLVAISLGICAVLSVLCAVLLPSYGIMHNKGLAGDWSGVFGHKNMLGKTMTLLCVCCTCLWSTRQARRSITACIFILAATLILLSQAKASLVVLFIMLLLVELIPILRWRASAMVSVGFALLAVFASIAVLIVVNIATLLGLLGKDTSLTGRVPLWAVVITSISRRPWLGYGYSAFWKGMLGPSASIREAVGWDVPHSHNGFLDIWLDLGVIGLILFCLLLLTSFSRAIRSFRDGNGYDSLWPLMLMSSFFLFNLTENTIMRPNYLYWVLLVACTVPHVLDRTGDDPGRAPHSDLDAHELSFRSKSIL